MLGLDHRAVFDAGEAKRSAAVAGQILNLFGSEHLAH